jgi:hypothetical protein
MTPTASAAANAGDVRREIGDTAVIFAMVTGLLLPNRSYRVGAPLSRLVEWI